MESRKSTLGDIADIVMGQSPKGENCNDIGAGLPLLNGPTEFTYNVPKPVQWTTDAKKVCVNGDILFCVRGSTTGKMNWADQEYAIGRGLAAIRHKNGKEFNEYIRAVIEYKLGEILNSATGSTFPNVSKDLLNNIEIPQICIEKQLKISQFIGMINKKIILNNKLNENLVQYVATVFRGWFIDFIGEHDLIDTEYGKRPKEWKDGCFGDLIEYTLGGDWGKETPQDNYTEEVYCIRGADIPEVKIGNKGKMPVRYILKKNYDAKKLKQNDLVIEISGGSPTQSTGRITAIPESLLKRYNNKGMVCTNFCRAVTPVNGYSTYIYSYWQYLYDKGTMFIYENGTTGIKNFDITSFIKDQYIVIPPKSKIDAFNEVVKPLMEKLFQNGYENEKLCILRGTLLPKLMSGEIDLSESKM